MANDGTLKQAGLTPEHVQSLRDLGTLLEKSNDTHKMAPLMKLLLHAGGVEAALHTGGAAAGGYAMSAALGKIMSNPELADTLVGALKTGSVVAPAVAAQTAPAIEKHVRP